MSERPFRPFGDKADLERELMDAAYRSLEGDEVGRLRSEDKSDVSRGRRETLVDATAPAAA